MVVPGADTRCCGVRGLQVRIGLVLGVAAAIVRQGDAFGDRVVLAADFLGDLAAVSVNAVLVNIVAKVHDGIEVALL